MITQLWSMSVPAGRIVGLARALDDQREQPDQHAHATKM